MRDMTSLDHIPELDRHRYDPVDSCIYCGAVEDLQDEHIVPFGLGGNVVLPKSSCPGCAQITSRFERAVLRGPLWAVRVHREIQSRRKHRDAPRTYPLTVVRGDVEETVELPADQYPILLHFLRFAPPAHLHPDQYESGIRLRGLFTVSFGPPPDEVARSLNASAIRIPQEGYDPVSSARLIAKIAYGLAAATGELERLDGTSTVLPAILGETDDVGRWVGTIDEPIRAHPGHLHRILLHRDDDRGLLIGDVQLLADSETPRYGVILGRLS